jgi:hypothetical protein
VKDDQIDIEKMVYYRVRIVCGKAVDWRRDTALIHSQNRPNGG